MKASLFYRIAAVLLLFFAVGHTLGFRQSDPNWGVDTVLGSMRSIHFDVQGFSRTYWDLFVAAGFSVGVQEHELIAQADVCNIGPPELIGPGQDHVPRQVRVDLAPVIGIRR